ncbi:conserved hypothetical protein [Pyrobaculum islandicum DSM 4184]|uniref:Uncharacterized protein n=1 Tax=Pyrobaculum islandicum (strain DSM 4184 / JCM 9189 / GEO3) TaxID=384616 RepID=A1RUJ7_PYRIL|nr:hypothetical protein [Pyrobaculum islandicum]ABL88629.1 conserved hypothetical protein [Pyrobaculum islandicum DSM 4184]
MVELVEATIVEKEPGTITIEDRVLLTYDITGVKIAKVGKGFVVAVDLSFKAKLVKPMSFVFGICAPNVPNAPNVPYKPAGFKVEKMAKATVKAGEVTIQIYVEPIAVALAEGYITPFGEPCVSISTITGWIAI